MACAVICRPTMPPAAACGLAVTLHMLGMRRGFERGREGLSGLHRMPQGALPIALVPLPLAWVSIWYDFLELEIGVVLALVLPPCALFVCGTPAFASCARRGRGACERAWAQGWAAWAQGWGANGDAEEEKDEEQEHEREDEQ